MEKTEEGDYLLVVDLVEDSPDPHPGHHAQEEVVEEVTDIHNGQEQEPEI